MENRRLVFEHPNYPGRVCITSPGHCRLVKGLTYTSATTAHMEKKMGNVAGSLDGAVGRKISFKPTPEGRVLLSYGAGILEYAETEQEAWDRVKAKTLAEFPGATGVVDTTLDKMPPEGDAHRTFRNAWHHVGDGVVQVHMTNAKEICKDLLRRERGPLLTKLDGEEMAATRNNNPSKLSEVRERKQELLDCTADPRVLNASTPEQLHSAMTSIVDEMKGV